MSLYTRIRDRWRGGPAAPTIEEGMARLQTRVAEQVSRLPANALMQLTEALDLSSSAMVDPLERYMGPDGQLWIPLGMGGDALPVDDSDFRDEPTLSWARAVTRVLSRSNPFAICGHENRISYIVGTGHVYRVAPKDDEVKVSPEQLAKAQAVIDRFTKANRWEFCQQEIVRRLDRDGEVFLRKYDGEADEDGKSTTILRFIEPAEVYRPDNKKDDPNAAFGIQTAKDDATTVEGYWVNGDLVEAKEIQHRKANVDCNVRRGRPTFWAARHLLRSAVETLLNIGATSDIQTRIAMIRRTPGVNRDAMQAVRTREADFQRANPATGKIENYKRYQRGSIIDVKEGVEYDFPAAGIDVSEYGLGVQAELRAVAAMVVMPEFMFTADASNANYSSTMVAEGPSVRNFERLQSTQRTYDLELMWPELEKAAESGEITAETLAAIQIQVTMPTLAVRDKLEEAQTYQIYLDKRILSPQTVTGKLGEKYEQEQKSIKEHDAANPPPEPTLSGALSQVDQVAQRAREAIWQAGGYPVG